MTKFKKYYRRRGLGMQPVWTMAPAVMDGLVSYRRALGDVSTGGSARSF